VLSDRFTNRGGWTWGAKQLNKGQISQRYHRKITGKARTGHLVSALKCSHGDKELPYAGFLHVVSIGHSEYIALPAWWRRSWLDTSKGQIVYRITEEGHLHIPASAYHLQPQNYA